jgi:hypothetical protein
VKRLVTVRLCASGEDKPRETRHDPVRAQSVPYAELPREFAVSAAPVGKLSVGDVGSFGEFSARKNPDGLVLVYVPGLAALLERARQLNGSELSEQQAARIAEHASVMAVTPEVAKETIENRGYE